ncbi:MAG: DUF362 domain-containing protein, partial [Nanoarchaeota archaeon]|nr:DUF362 domain-containing protein [Nanoarchaeota archaeon]
MTEVYFSQDIETILDRIPFEVLGKSVAIKVHFGEKGCTTFLSPRLVQKVYDKIISSGRDASLVECNVLYKGSRTNSTDHLKTAKEHGFTDMNIDILDGELGDEFIDVMGCKLGKGLEKYDSIIILSHFKGHMMTGFGGAIKNTGMGLGSRAGKLHMHSRIKPSVNQNRCKSCEICINNCNAKAISLNKTTNKAKIDSDKCEGCAMCISICPERAINIPWASETSEGLQKKIAEYSKAALSIFKNSAIFINVLQNITEDCDCLDKPQKPVLDDIGFLLSDNIVAIDQASLDLANNKGFNAVQKSIEKQPQIEHAANMGIGSKNY